MIGDARRASFFFARVVDDKLVEGPSLYSREALEMKILESHLPLFASERLPQFPRATLAYPTARKLATLARDQFDETDKQYLEKIVASIPI